MFGHIWTCMGRPSLTISLSPAAAPHSDSELCLFMKFLKANTGISLPEIPECEHRSAPKILGSKPPARRRSDCHVQHEEPEVPAPTLGDRTAKICPVPKFWCRIPVPSAGIQWQHQGGSAGCLSRSLAVAAVTRSRQRVLQPLPCSISISQGCTSREPGRKPGKLELYSWCCH